MNSKAIWAGVSISIITAITQAQALNSHDNYSIKSEEQTSTIAHIRPEIDGGVTVIKNDGSEVYFNKAQISVLNTITGKGSVIFKNSAFCATRPE